MKRAQVFGLFLFIQFPLLAQSNLKDSTQVLSLLEQAENEPDLIQSTAIAQHAWKSSEEIGYINGITKSLNHLAWAYSSRGKYDSAIYYSRVAIDFSKSKFLVESEALASQALGESYMRLHQGDSALKFLTIALHLSKQLKWDNFEAGVYNNIANVYLNENNYEEALTYFITSANKYDSAKDLIGFSKALSNIGNVEYQMGHLDKALAYASKSKEMATISNHTSGIGYAHKLLGWIKRKKGDLNGAMSNYDSAIAIYTKLGFKRDIAEIALSTGNAYYDLKEYKKAIRYYEKSLSASIALNYEPFMPYAYSGLSSSYYSLNDFPTALKYADLLEKSAEQIDLYLLLDAYDIKSSIWEKEKDFANALTYSRKFQVLKDSLTDIENRKALEEAEAKFQNDLKQKEIDQLKGERDLRESRTRTMQIGVGATLILIIVIGGLVVNRYKIINQSKKQLEIERMRNSIARDLHDDIGSALSSINIMSQVALQGNELSVIQQNFKRIGEQSSRIMESMTDIVWSINPGNDSLEKLTIKMREFAAEMVEPRNIQLRFQAATQDKTLDAEQRKNLFLIFKEALNNAVKYSQCTTVSIELTLEKHQVKLRIEDDGNGFNVSEKTTGNGLRNMKARAQSLNGSLSIESHLSNGTTIELSVPTT